MDDDDEKKEIAEELGLDLEEIEEIDKDKLKLMAEHGIDEDTAEKAKELIDEGLDEGEAVELADEI